MPSVPSITLLLKGTSEPNKVPMVSALKPKELAINYNDGLLFSLNSDNTIATYLNSSRLPYLLSATLSSAAPQYGGNTLGNNGTNGAILGGTNNTLNHENSFILGTNITSTEANYTYVNNLSAAGSIRASVLYGDGSNITGVTAIAVALDNTKLPLSGGVLTGSLTGTSVYCSDVVISSSLELNADQSAVLYVNTSAVGIGTETPTALLDVNGGMLVQELTSNTGMFNSYVSAGTFYGDGSNLDGVALVSHTHTTSDVTGLDTKISSLSSAIDDKLSTSGGTLTGGLTGTDALMQGSVRVDNTLTVSGTISANNSIVIEKNSNPLLNIAGSTYPMMVFRDIGQGVTATNRWGMWVRPNSVYDKVFDIGPMDVDGNGNAMLTFTRPNSATSARGTIQAYTDFTTTGLLTAGNGFRTTGTSILSTVSASIFYGDGSNLAGVALVSHTHATSDVTGLDTKISSLSSAIDDKLSTSGGTITGSLSVLGSVTYVDTNVAVTSAVYIDTSSTETALRITQRGTGLALLVEDSENPDSTSFAINADGNVGIGINDPAERLTVSGNISASGYYKSSGYQGSWLQLNNESFPQVQFRDNETNKTNHWGMWTGATPTYAKSFHIGPQNTSGSGLGLITLTRQTSTTNDLGNVGIGTSTPAARLAVFNNSSTEPACLINQTGTANALVVEDSTNPDGTPFVIDASGNVLIGLSSAMPTEQVSIGKVGTPKLGFWSYNSTSSVAGNITFNRSASSTIGLSAAPLVDGTNVGLIDFRYFDVSPTPKLLRSASIQGEVQGATRTAGYSPGRLTFCTAASSTGSGDAVERMRIDSEGRVGIGTSSPRGLLHVNGGDTLLSNGTVSVSAGNLTVTGGSITSNTALYVSDGGSGGATIADGNIYTNNLNFFSTGKTINDGYYRGSRAAATYTIGAAAQSAVNVVVTGASLGDFVIPSVNVPTGGLLVTASVTATDSVAVIIRNETASSVTLTTATVKALVIK